MMKGYIKYTLVVLCAFAIEVVFFNFWNIASIIQKNEEQVDILTSSEAIEYIDEDGAQQIGRIIFIPSGMRINTISIETNVKCTPEVVYGMGGVLNKESFFSLDKTNYAVRIGKKIDESITIIGLNGAEVVEAVINEPRIVFSFARFFAMIIVYLSGAFLFSLQKMPDYHIVDNMK